MRSLPSTVLTIPNGQPALRCGPVVLGYGLMLVDTFVVLLSSDNFSLQMIFWSGSMSGTGGDGSSSCETLQTTLTPGT